MVGFAKQLETEFKLDARKAFNEAVRTTLERVRTDDVVPFDTGNLLQGIKTRNRVVTGDIFKIEFYSAARSRHGQFDYPEYLERVTRVAPTNKEFLHFRSSGGDWVRSKGFDNRHNRWWTKLWRLQAPPSLWDAEVKVAFERIFGGGG